MKNATFSNFKSLYALQSLQSPIENLTNIGNITNILTMIGMMLIQTTVNSFNSSIFSSIIAIIFSVLSIVSKHSFNNAELNSVWGIIAYFSVYNLIYNIKKIQSNNASSSMFNIVVDIVTIAILYLPYHVMENQLLHSIAIMYEFAHRFSYFHYCLFFWISSLFNKSPYKILHTDGTYIRHILYSVMHLRTANNIMVSSEEIKNATMGDLSWLLLNWTLMITNTVLFSKSNDKIPSIISTAVTSITFGRFLYLLVYEKLKDILSSLYRYIEPMIVQIRKLMRNILYQLLKFYLIYLDDFFVALVTEIIKLIKPFFNSLFVDYILLYFLQITLTLDEFQPLPWYVRFMLYPMMSMTFSKVLINRKELENEPHRNENDLFMGISLLLSIASTIVSCANPSFQKVFVNICSLLLAQLNTSFTFLHDLTDYSRVLALFSSMMCIFCKRRYKGDSILVYMVPWIRNICISIYLSFKTAEIEDVTLRIMFQDVIQNLCIIGLDHVQTFFSTSETWTIETMNSMHALFTILFSTINTSSNLFESLYNSKPEKIVLVVISFIFNSLQTIHYQKLINHKTSVGLLKYVQLFIYASLVTSKLVSWLQNIFLITLMALMMIIISIWIRTKQIEPMNSLYQILFN